MIAAIYTRNADLEGEAWLRRQFCRGPELLGGYDDAGETLGGKEPIISGAILLFVGLRTSLRASRYETSERWFRLGLWAMAIGIAAQTIGGKGG